MDSIGDLLWDQGSAPGAGGPSLGPRPKLEVKNGAFGSHLPGLTEKQVIYEIRISTEIKFKTNKQQENKLCTRDYLRQMMATSFICRQCDAACCYASIGVYRQALVIGVSPGVAAVLYSFTVQLKTEQTLPIGLSAPLYLMHFNARRCLHHSTLQA